MFGPPGVCCGGPFCILAQTLFRDSDYIPAAPDVPPRDPRMRPNDKNFRGIFFSPERVDAGMPYWMKTFDEIYR